MLSKEQAPRLFHDPFQAAIREIDLLNLSRYSCYRRVAHLPRYVYRWIARIEECIMPCNDKAVYRATFRYGQGTVRSVGVGVLIVEPESCTGGDYNSRHAMRRECERPYETRGGANKTRILYCTHSDRPSCHNAAKASDR